MGFSALQHTYTAIGAKPMCRIESFQRCIRFIIMLYHYAMHFRRSIITRRDWCRWYEWCVELFIYVAVFLIFIDWQVIVNNITFMTVFPHCVFLAIFRVDPNLSAEHLFFQKFLKLCHCFFKYAKTKIFHTHNTHSCSINIVCKVRSQTLNIPYSFIAISFQNDARMINKNNHQ